MFALLLAAVLSLTPTGGKENVQTYDASINGAYDGIESTQETINVTFEGVDLNLGEKGIKIRSKDSLLIFKDSSTLHASANWEQYNEQTGGQNLYNTSYIAIDGKLIVKPNGYTITLHRVKSASEKTAAIIVKGEGELILNNPDNVTVVRPEDLKGLAIQVKAKKEAK